MKLEAIRAIRLVSRDGAALAKFYAALGFVVGEPVTIPQVVTERYDIKGTARRWPMRLGLQHVEIDEYEDLGQAYPEDADAADVCFQHFAMVTTRIAEHWQRALGAGVKPISTEGPVTLPASSGGVTAVKFRDPEGHPLELLQYADPARHGWERQGLLGIDHSAISVSDLNGMERYFIGHGLAVAGGSHNRGAQQDALDGLAGVDALVRPLKPAAAPPHLELLAYARLRDTSAYRGAVNDVASTRLVWQSDTPDTLFRDPAGHWHETVHHR